MSRPFIVIGDQTDHGGVVIEASVMTDTHGKGIARVGDQVTCPKRNHGTTVIVTGDPTMIIDGKAAARHGDKCACGATLISSQFVSTVGGGAAGASENSSQDASHSAPGARMDQAADLSTMHEPLSAKFDDRFKLVDDETGEPLSNVEYAIKRASGKVEYGTTDGAGNTHLLSSSTETESVEIYA
jgi:uncharacterized Zn-binding protein involved in type VI secretion